MRRPGTTKHKTLASFPTDEDRYIAVIAGLFGKDATPHAPIFPLSHLFERYEGWLTEPNVLVLKYEDIVGPKGGGDQSEQLAAYRRLSDHIGLAISDGELAAMIDGIYSEGGAYFVKGQRGQWRDVFTPRVHNVFESAFARRHGHWLEGVPGHDGEPGRAPS